ncbi:class I histocompatibility antigen, F10 alpha chain-like [Colossoma macropomum]|uniref:class I histocompatibility antigen, F10 alpha chain-like n=1 Tax=Colossoma macropomum TaxID=42526 RepID=UPI001864F6FF|nr:class I histocompatibility antigen, F10 alpha chain-like [Colossoma macropomum]
MFPEGLKGLCCLPGYRTAMIKLLLFLSVSVYGTSAASHSLRYISTAITPGTDFPQYTVVGLVDGEPLMYYDSNIRKMTPKTEWLEKNMGEDYWNSDSDIFMGEQKWSLSNMDTTMKRHNDTEGIHTWQWTYGCELHGNGTTTAYSKFAYDGQDYIQLDLDTGTFTGHKNSFLLNWKKRRVTDCKHYLEIECIEELKMFVDFGRSTLERKVSPEASLFQKDSSSPVVCHATGFFPKAVMISWQKNGEDLHEDVDLRETLPNQDGTFQKRSVLTVSPEELDKHNYTCIIQHSSLEKEMVLPVSDRQVLPSGGSDGGLDGVPVGAVVFFLLLILIGCVGFFILKKKQETETTENEMQETEKKETERKETEKKQTEMQLISLQQM